MANDPRKREIQTAAADLANCLIEGDYYAGIHLARLLLADNGGSLRLFIRALTVRLQRWPTKEIQESDVAEVLRAAARDVIGKTERG